MCSKSFNKSVIISQPVMVVLLHLAGRKRKKKWEDREGGGRRGKIKKDIKSAVKVLRWESEKEREEEEKRKLM